MPSFAGHGAEARPYTLALTASIGATFFLVRWVQSQRKLDLVFMAACLILVVYLHYLFVAIVLLHIVFVLVSKVQGAALDLKGYAIALLSVMLAGSPLAWHALSVVTSGEYAHGTGRKLSVGDLLDSLITGRTGFYAALILFAVAASTRLTTIRSSTTAGVLASAWWILPPTCFYLVEKFTGIAVFMDRYMLTSAVALPFIAALVLSYRSALPAQLCVFAVITATIIPTPSGFRAAVNVDNGWGYAKPISDVKRLDPGGKIPVAFQSYLMESPVINWTDTDPASNRLYAPFVAYPVRNPIIVLPVKFDNAAKKVLNSRLLASPNRAHLFLISTESAAGTTVRDWLRLVGYKVDRVGGNLHHAVYEATALEAIQALH